MCKLTGSYSAGRRTKKICRPCTFTWHIHTKHDLAPIVRVEALISGCAIVLPPTKFEPHRFRSNHTSAAVEGRSQLVPSSRSVPLGPTTTYRPDSRLWTTGRRCTGRNDCSWAGRHTDRLPSSGGTGVSAGKRTAAADQYKKPSCR